MADDYKDPFEQPVSRSERLRKLAADTDKYGPGGVEGIRRKKVLNEEAGIEDALDVGGGQRQRSSGNPLHYIGRMRFLK